MSTLHCVLQSYTITVQQCSDWQTRKTIISAFGCTPLFRETFLACSSSFLVTGSTLSTMLSGNSHVTPVTHMSLKTHLQRHTHEQPEKIRKFFPINVYSSVATSYPYNTHTKISIDLISSVDYSQRVDTNTYKEVLFWSSIAVDTASRTFRKF